jgi:surface polysaccharide O-acyltransferase-like enzyme
MAADFVGRGLLFTISRSSFGIYLIHWLVQLISTGWSVDRD